MKLARLLLLLAIIVVAAFIAVYHFFGLWGVAGVFAGLVILMKVATTLVVRGFKQFGLGLFKAKGAALSGAALAVNSVTSAAPPALSEEEEEGLEEDETRQPTKFYFLDVTISPPPREADGKCFTMWEPGELVLAGENAQGSDLLNDLDSDSDQTPGAIYSVEPFEDGAFIMDEGHKFEGEKRLRLHVGLHDPSQLVKLRYYFEVFGEIRIPEELR